MKGYTRKLLAVMLACAIVLSMVGFTGIKTVNAEVSDDIIKLTGIILNQELEIRREVVGFIATGAPGEYVFRSDMTDTQMTDAANSIANITLDDGHELSEQISAQAVKNALEDMSNYFETQSFYVNYVLNKFGSSLRNFTGLHPNGLTNAIAAKTFSYELFLNLLIDIEDMTGLKPLYYYTDTETLELNPSIVALANVIKNLPGFSQLERFADYQEQFNSYLSEVNNWSNADEKLEFVGDLNDYWLFDPIIPPDDDDDNGGGSGSGGSGGGGGGSTTTTTDTTTPAPNTPASTIAAKPTLIASTGKAIASITQSAITSALGSAVPSAQGVKAATIQVPAVTGAKSYAVELPSDALNTTAASHTIEIVTQVASVKLPSNMITGTAGNNKVELTVANAEAVKLSDNLKAQIGSKPVIELSLKVGGKQVNWNNADAPVTVSVAYTPTGEELKNPEHIVVWYIDGSNNVVSVPSGKYDPATGKVTFRVDHFSKYAVAYNVKTFSDLDKHTWARKQIEVMASKGIVSGISADKFNPAEMVTRGDYLKSLINTLGLSAKFESSFDDVKATDTYYKEIAVAKKLGITTGVGNNKYTPEAAITRQDMMVLTAKALSIAKQIALTDSTLEINSYSDQSKIAGYARTSTAAMIRTGLIVGDGKNVNPYANTSRAEAAVIMYRIYNK